MKKEFVIGMLIAGIFFLFGCNWDGFFNRQSHPDCSSERIVLNGSCYSGPDSNGTCNMENNQDIGIEEIDLIEGMRVKIISFSKAKPVSAGVFGNLIEVEMSKKGEKIGFDDICSKWPCVYAFFKDDRHVALFDVHNETTLLYSCYDGECLEDILQRNDTYVLWIWKQAAGLASGGNSGEFAMG